MVILIYFTNISREKRTFSSLDEARATGTRILSKDASIQRMGIVTNNQIIMLKGDNIVA